MADRRFHVTIIKSFNMFPIYKRYDENDNDDNVEVAWTVFQIEAWFSSINTCGRT